MEKDFAETYDTVEWSKKRLHVLQRDDWKCQLCGKPGNQVHHRNYRNCSDNKCFNCPEEDLITLCDECHATLHAIKSESLKCGFFDEDHTIKLESNNMVSTSKGFYQSCKRTYKVTDNEVRQMYVHKMIADFLKQGNQRYYCNIHPLTKEKFLAYIILGNEHLMLIKFKYSNILLDKSVDYKTLRAENLKYQTTFEEKWKEIYGSDFQKYVEVTKQMTDNPNVGLEERNNRWAEQRDRTRYIKSLIEQ